jgi:hypothetical protein
MLKLQAGSTEAGYLAAIYPLPKTPTVVIMNKGELKEYIAAGVSREDFISRTAKALGASSSQPQPTTAAAAATTTSSTPSTNSTQPEPQSSPQVQSLLAERAARLETLRAEQQRKAAEQRRKDKGKTPDTSSPSSSKPKDPAQAKYSAELKQRQQQAREDRARVLQAIADDKAARRAKALERQAERAMLSGGGPVSHLPEEKARLPMEDGSRQQKCKLQIRLFDGSTVRGEWEGTETLGGEVRSWLEGQDGMKDVRGGAYAFKVILTPKPSRTIEVAEEGRTLGELGLTPSATLVLIPAAGKVYPATVGGNPATRVLMMIMGVFTGLWSLIVAFLGSMFGSAIAPPQPAQVHGRETGGSGSATGRDQTRKGGLRQLRPEGERKNEQQFYNGNSVRLRLSL